MLWFWGLGCLWSGKVVFKASILSGIRRIGEGEALLLFPQTECVQSLMLSNT